MPSQSNAGRGGVPLSPQYVNPWTYKDTINARMKGIADDVYGRGDSRQAEDFLNDIGNAWQSAKDYVSDLWNGGKHPPTENLPWVVPVSPNMPATDDPRHAQMLLDARIRKNWVPLDELRAKAGPDGTPLAPQYVDPYRSPSQAGGIGIADKAKSLSDALDAKLGKREHQTNLLPLLQLVDSWTGSNLASGYEDPNAKAAQEDYLKQKLMLDKAKTAADIDYKNKSADSWTLSSKAKYLEALARANGKNQKPEIGMKDLSILEGKMGTANKAKLGELADLSNTIIESKGGQPVYTPASLNNRLVNEAYQRWQNDKSKRPETHYFEALKKLEEGINQTTQAEGL